MTDETLKKLGLGGLVGITLVAYGIKVRHESGVVNAPTTTNATTSPAPAQGTSSSSSGKYKDGTYTGSVANAFYGNVQVQATIKGGKITDVEFLQYPNDRSTSREINSQAIPYLQQEAIQAQSANVDVVSGATDTSQAFTRSLNDALSQAQG